VGTRLAWISGRRVGGALHRRLQDAEDEEEQPEEQGLTESWPNERLVCLPLAYAQRLADEDDLSQDESLDDGEPWEK
jgi:hypothetical protein